MDLKNIDYIDLKQDLILIKEILNDKYKNFNNFLDIETKCILFENILELKEKLCYIENKLNVENKLSVENKLNVEIN